MDRDHRRYAKPHIEMRHNKNKPQELVWFITYDFAYWQQRSRYTDWERALRALNRHHRAYSEYYD